MRGGGVCEDANVREFFQAFDASSVIAVLVRQKNRINAPEFLADGGEKRFEFSRGKARIDEHAGALGDEQGAVARAAAAEDAKTHGHFDGER